MNMRGGINNFPILMLLTAEDLVCACVVDVLSGHFHLRDLFAFGQTSTSSN
jgi:hypothetical protein